MDPKLPTEAYGSTKDPELAEAFANLALKHLLSGKVVVKAVASVTHGNQFLSVTLNHQGQPASFTVNMSFEAWLKLAYKMGKESK